MYFDPDTFVFGNLQNIEDELQNNKEIILTPHILSPIPLDGKMPTEHLFLNFGTYNLGFIGIKNPKENIPFFKWWGERTYNIGYDRVADGLFVDQLWMNFAPVFYDNVVVSKNLGLNMGPWNLHERFLTFQNKWIVNQDTELVFYHFSNYKYKTPEVLASYYDRYDFSNRADLVPLYNDYLKLLIENNIEKLSEISCIYVILHKKYRDEVERKQGEEWQATLINRSLTTKVKDKLKRLLKQ